MNRWRNLAGQVRFTDLLQAFEEYARPFRPMWPFFWLKAAAIRVDDVWHLCVFSLSGQWDDTRGAPPVEPPQDAVALLSKRLDAAAAWQMIESMVATNSLDGIMAIVPDIQLSPSILWQHSYSFISELAADVAEPAQWWYFYADGQTPWLRDGEQLGRAAVAIQPTLDYLSEQSFASLVSSRFAGQRPPRGNFSSFDSLSYHLDLPLALRVNVNAYRPFEQRRQIAVDAHAPLALSDLVITEGDIPAPTQPPLTIEQYAATEGGWAFGNASLAKTTSRLRIASPELGRILFYEFTVPALPEVVANAVAYLYAPYEIPTTGKGQDKWERDLLHGKAAAFEVALLNALTRLGIPVLFGGQFTAPDGKTGGTATPGFDLVALDYRNQRAVAISAKGAEKLPTHDHIQTLRQSVRALGVVLDGWLVFALIACHAPPGDFARWDKPADMNVWGPEELQLLLHASSAQAVAGLLWVPPWAPYEERLLYQLFLPRNSGG